MNKNMKIFVFVNICIFAAVVTFILLSLAFWDSGKFACAFFEKTHIYCPGCGGTRAFFALLRLDILTSLKYNPSVIFGVAVFIYYDIRAFIAIKKDDIDYFSRNRYYLAIAFAVFAIVYFFVRNFLLLKYHIDLIGDVVPTP